MPDSITIAFDAELLATLLALLALIALSLWSGLLPSLLGDRFGQGWGRLPATVRAVLGSLGALWGALLLVSMAAGITGALALVANPGAGGLGLGALLVALLGAPFLLWSTIIRQTTLDYQREGHITDRISKAVEQLGTERTVKVPGEDGNTVERSEPNIEVRIGGILALERIAQDSTRLDEGRDHVRVMEILCAYIRENSKARPPEDFPEPEWQPLDDAATAGERAAREDRRRERFGTLGFLDSKARNWAETLPGPRVDVQLALDVIGRRWADQLRVEAGGADPGFRPNDWVFKRPVPSLPGIPGNGPMPETDLDAFRERLEGWKDALRTYGGYRIDLRGANLQGADLSKRCFSGARLNGSHMEGADLRKTQLVGTELTMARMEGAILWEANMAGAILWGARMEGASLYRAGIEGGRAEGARMDGTDLRKARMQGALLPRVHMEGAILGEARMEGAILVEARMEGTVLRGTRMAGADLRDVRLEGAKLWGAQMRGAALAGAPLKGVTVSAGVLSTQQIATMFGDGSVTLPGIPPGGEGWPTHWPVRALDWREFEAEWRKWQADPVGYRPPR